MMELKDVKHYFFARRNGNTADMLKRGGSGFGMIFGCDVPSLSALAREIGPDPALARLLWEDRNVRESHLLAPWLMNPDALSFDECMELAGTTVDMEDALMLAFRVLKRRADARQIFDSLPEGSVARAALGRHLDI